MLFLLFSHHFIHDGNTFVKKNYLIFKNLSLGLITEFTAMITKEEWEYINKMECFMRLV